IGHGRAVSIGMVAAASFSVQKGLLSNKEFHRIKSVLGKLNLPVELSSFDDSITSFKDSLNKSHSTPDDSDKLIDNILNAMLKDKKKDNDKIGFVFLNGIGKCVVEKITFEELRNLLVSAGI
ncbi:MAG: hypothetical protein HQK65_18325, partial [Desulfamplus sp.]|nr:hypothetical protein [Desulfamplus sp.]